MQYPNLMQISLIILKTAFYRFFVWLANPQTQAKDLIMINKMSVFPFLPPSVLSFFPSFLLNEHLLTAYYARPYSRSW